MIPKNATDPENGLRQARFFPSARRAWCACLRGLNPRRILLPAYIGYTDREGSGVFDPIAELELPFSFYPVGRELLADPAVIAACLSREPDIDLVLLIHYFGWPGGNVSAIRSACDSAGAVLIEDCAHAFHWGQAEASLGITGDFAFFSIHKYLASKSGGLLHAVAQEYPAKMESVCEPIDPKVLELLARADLHAIALKRRENLVRALEGLSIIEGVRPLRADIPLAPHSLPIWVDGEKMREKLYFYLIERGIPTTALYYRLHQSLGIKEFPESYEVSDHILNLPIHQDMTSDQIHRMLFEIRFGLKQLRA